MNPAVVPLRALETLWIQVTGTLCNIKCNHCFISCSPTNDALGMMDRALIARHVADAIELGTHEFYMTGGEPFLHDEIDAIIADVLGAGPLTVLTNATLIDADRAQSLAEVERLTGNKLTLRVSLDGPDSQRNDVIRGKGVFTRTCRGIGHLADAGFRPIITMMRSWEESQDTEVLAALTDNLARAGYCEARIKLLPILHLGAEEKRSRGYLPTEAVTAACIEGHDLDTLLCHTARLVSADGVHVCPILVGEEGSIVGQSLDSQPASFELNHAACFTCVVSGAICSNDSTV